MHANANLIQANLMHGTVEIHEMQSAVLAGNPLGDPPQRRMPVYLPPGYSSSSDRFPTVYFLHGFSGSATSWLNSSSFTPNVIERLDDLIGKEVIPPVLGVFVDGWTALGGSQWINSEAIGRYREYLARDVVTHFDQTLRTIPKATSRAVVGKSSGGYGALVMACRHPEVFAHVASHSGDAYFEYCYLPEFPKAAGPLLKAGGVEPWFREFSQRARETRVRSEDFPVINLIAMSAAYSPKKGEPMGLELPFDLPTARIRPDVWGRWLVNDPVRFVPRSLPALAKLSSLFIDCGARDEYSLRWGARMLVDELRAAQIEVVHEEFEDGHVGINYRYDRSLSYIAPRMARS
jgi:S-formylglutathione hydrolase FrmB